MQHANGVVDLRAADDAEAVALAKRYLSYFRGAAQPGAVPDQRLLRELIPEQRKRVYEVRRVVETLFDEGSVLELRSGFGPGMLTALARVDGRPLGVVANDPTHLGGAIDADGADKAARFLALCDAFELPVLFLCDTPGFMVGPAAERTATVRHFARMFLGGANVSVPTGTIVLRKGYGLGAQAMAGGGFKAPLFTSPGRRRSSARWAWRARCAWACGASSTRSRTPRSASGYSRRRSPRPTSAAWGRTWPPTARSTT